MLPRTMLQKGRGHDGVHGRGILPRGGDVMPTIVSSFFKGPGNTQDGGVIVQRTMWNGEQTHPALTCNNAGGGIRGCRTRRTLTE